ncbi:hypothetical protein HMPREF9136_0158 [Prevotella dentalis DSM 3688]|uniref:Uncharacterized protein n=1 Tax=Prevotella dentalis (strain ATCC 49559 / DSM 3688 / JCM 13448 / NCTC 12043 / ES 2772) TaxID=908937 RepID=F9CZY1_PREDD|nr:hypothetical protein HMPREF9136_0158 [Prevotella dentalis DSM 3688]
MSYKCFRLIHDKDNNKKGEKKRRPVYFSSFLFFKVEKFALSQ